MPVQLEAQTIGESTGPGNKTRKVKEIMRWFLGVTTALFLTWAGYMASPYIALWTLAGAIERGDVAAVSARVNVHALRASLARQVAAEELKRVAPAGQTMSAGEQQLAASALTLLADPLMQQFLRPASMVQLLQALFTGRETQTPKEDGSAGADQTSIRLGRLTEILGASRWRGFRNFYVSLPATRPVDQRFRLQLRFSRLAWRLVAVDLPPGRAERMSRDLARRALDTP